MTVRYLVNIILTIGITTFPSFSQSGGNRNLFVDAEFDLLDQAYTVALPKFLRVLDEDTLNCNYNYRVGLCYYNIPGKLKESLPYLIKASQKTSRDYKEGNYKEINAPIDVFLYLGNVYKSINDKEKTKEAYSNFLEKVNPDEKEKIEIVKRQIASIKIAEELEKKPVPYKKKNLGKPINNERMNFAPALSGDMKTMAFTNVDLNGINFIYISTKDENGEWSNPQNITRLIGSSGDCKTADLNYDGTKMILIKQDNFDSDIYLVDFKKGKWGKMYKMNKYVNSKKYWETHASFSYDDKTIYFTSDRKKGIGGLDIYKTEMDDNGWWGMSENIGTPINTPYDEETPFVTSDGTMFFSSQGNATMGGYDIFYAKPKEDGGWEEPVNLGYPINSVNDDIFFSPMPDGVHAMYTVYSDEGLGGLDIYQYEIFTDNNPHYIELTGKLIPYQNDSSTLENIKISILNNVGDFEIAATNTNNSGGFNYPLTPGNYILKAIVPGYNEFTKSVFIPDDYIEDEYELNINLEKLEEIAFADNTGNNETLTENKIVDETNTSESNLLTNNNTTTNESDEYITPAYNTDQNSEELNIMPDKISVIQEQKEVNNTKNNIPALTLDTEVNHDINKFIPQPKITPKNNLSDHNTTEYLYNRKEKYTIQILAVKNFKSPDLFTNKESIMVFKGNDGRYRYVYGYYKKREDARKDLRWLNTNGFKFAYISELSFYVKGAKSNEYTIQILMLKNYKSPESFLDTKFESFKLSKEKNGLYRYTIGEYITKPEAEKALKSLKEKGFKHAYIKEISAIPEY